MNRSHKEALLNPFSISKQMQSDPAPPPLPTPPLLIKEEEEEEDEEVTSFGIMLGLTFIRKNLRSLVLVWIVLKRKEGEEEEEEDDEEEEEETATAFDNALKDMFLLFYLSGYF